MLSIIRCRQFSQAVLLLSVTLTPKLKATDVDLPGNTVELEKGWKLQSSCKLSATGKQISSSDYKTAGWLPALVPGTVLGSQVEAGIFPDPYFGMNLRNIPGTDYPIGKIFGYFPMNDTSPYRCSWWYRKEFQSPVGTGPNTWLHFDGINYRANLWLNGTKIADKADVAGAFRAYDFNVSKLLSNGTNTLAVEVFAQTENDLGIDFLDWNPAPADKSMGLWRGVSLHRAGPVTVRYPAIETHFPKDDLSEAQLTVIADVANESDHPSSANVTASVGQIRVSQQIELLAHQSKTVLFTPADFPQLKWKQPPIWWPYQYGEPHLESLRVVATLDGILSDEAKAKVGIRESQAFLNPTGALQFQINHRNILIRGGGWTPDLLYREPETRLRQELTYVKGMNLNTIRLEGKLGSEDLFRLADEMGILVMAGWQCCDAWQHWDKWTAKDHEIASASTYSQISRLRPHPSVFVWLNGSDEIPAQPVEGEFLAVLKDRHWPNPVMSTAADRTSPITGKSGVKMSGPYDYVPPEYWYLDHDKVGGAFSFNTETGPGPAIPSIESIQRTLPKDKWWPINEQWNYHAGLGKFAQYDNFNRAMNATYGTAASLEDYVRKAQLMAYDGERAMFEAYAANKYNSTGVIQWMLNNAWPSFIWHLYDYYLVPGGGYFGTQKANEPIHIQYRYDDRRIIVVNATLHAFKDLVASIKTYDLAGKMQASHQTKVDVAPDGTATVFSLEESGRTTLVQLQLHDTRGKLVSTNFYWIPGKLAALDWQKSTYVNTPALSYADMRDLSSMPAASVDMSARQDRSDGKVLVTLRNNKPGIAFLLHLRLVFAGTENEVVPVLWDDNFISIPSGESRVLMASGLEARGAKLEVKLDGWNVKPISAKVGE